MEESKRPNDLQELHELNKQRDKPLYFGTPQNRQMVYKTRIEPYLNDVVRWLAQGETQYNVANKLGVDNGSFSELKSRHSALDQAVEMGLAILQSKLEKSLYKKAMGYDTEEVTLTENLDAGGNPYGRKKRETKTKHHEPDTNALQFALKNLDPDKWKDKQELSMRGDLDIGERATKYEALFSELDSEPELDTANETPEEQNQKVDATYVDRREEKFKNQDDVDEWYG